MNFNVPIPIVYNNTKQETNKNQETNKKQELIEKEIREQTGSVCICNVSDIWCLLLWRFRFI